MRHWLWQSARWVALPRRMPNGDAITGAHSFLRSSQEPAIRGGLVYGGSDKDAAYPIDNPTSPEDLAATIYHALGIDPELRLRDTQGRPVSIVDGGKPVTALFG